MESTTRFIRQLSLSGKGKTQVQCKHEGSHVMVSKCQNICWGGVS